MYVVGTEEHQPCIQFVCYRFIVHFFPENVKRNEDIFLQEFYLDACIRPLLEAVNTGMRVVVETSGTVLEKDDCIDGSEELIIILFFFVFMC